MDDRDQSAPVEIACFGRKGRGGLGVDVQIKLN
jgi:hypothetical protein